MECSSLLQKSCGKYKQEYRFLLSTIAIKLGSYTVQNVCVCVCVSLCVCHCVCVTVCVSLCVCVCV